MDFEGLGCAGIVLGLGSTFGPHCVHPQVRAVEDQTLIGPGLRGLFGIDELGNRKTLVRNPLQRLQRTAIGSQEIPQVFISRRPVDSPHPHRVTHLV